MGFEEMPTNNYIEVSYWNFDVLFQPQQHPARDAHDTFFLTHPATSDGFPEEYLQRVKVGSTQHDCVFDVVVFWYVGRAALHMIQACICVYVCQGCRMCGRLQHRFLTGQIGGALMLCLVCNDAL